MSSDLVQTLTGRRTAIKAVTVFLYFAGQGHERDMYYTCIVQLYVPVWSVVHMQVATRWAHLSAGITYYYSISSAFQR